jgi:hypothetical protein
MKSGTRESGSGGEIPSPLPSNCARGRSSGEHFCSPSRHVLRGTTTRVLVRFTRVSDRWPCRRILRRRRRSRQTTAGSRSRVTARRRQPFQGETAICQDWHPGTPGTRACGRRSRTSRTPARSPDRGIRRWAFLNVSTLEGGSRFTVHGSRFKVQGSPFTVQGSRFRVLCGIVKVRTVCLLNTEP